MSGSFPATPVASGMLEPGSAQWRCQARLARWLARLSLGYMAAEGSIAVAAVADLRETPAWAGGGPTRSSRSAWLRLPSGKDARLGRQRELNAKAAGLRAAAESPL